MPCTPIGPTTPKSIPRLVFCFVFDLKSAFLNLIKALVPVELMTKDEAFLKSFSASVQDLCQKQTLALKQVMDLAQELRANEKEKK